MKIRLPVLTAIAGRDLTAQLRGRRGWVLPVITGVLLAPIAMIPGPEPRPPDEIGFVSGDVPAEVLALESTTHVHWGEHRFRRTDEGLQVRTAKLPEDVRAVLDGDAPTLAWEEVPPDPVPLPGRTLFLALLASSLLTGSVSESIPGERSRGTLEALLTAAVTRAEVVLGKWAAWSLFGAVAAGAAGLLAVITGTVEPGPWLAALPTVPLGTVALGMFLVRRARDVVGGATVSLRVLPALLSGLGLGAWFIGLSADWAGALVPIGGALVAAGGTWEGWLAPSVAIASTLGTTALLLAWTARDLERPVTSHDGSRRWDHALGALWIVLAWWAGTGAAVSWHPAGNPRVSRDLPLEPGLLAGVLGLWTVTAIAAVKDPRPGEMLGLRRPYLPALAVAPILGAALALPTAVPWLPASRPEAIDLLLLRVDAAVAPLSFGLLGLAVLVTHEVVFRGWMQQRVGPFLAVIVYALAVSPVDPLRGLVVGASLAALTHVARGSILPAVVAHLVLAAVAWSLA